MMTMIKMMLRQTCAIGNGKNRYKEIGFNLNHALKVQFLTQMSYLVSEGVVISVYCVACVHIGFNRNLWVLPILSLV